MDILLIGCGQMGGALLKQWRQTRTNCFTVADPAVPTLGTDLRHVTSASALKGAKFDMIIIAVKPQLIAQVLPDYRLALRAGGVFVSIAAGASCATYETILGQVPLVRVMPNLPAMVGQGVSGLYANAACTPQHLTQVTNLMAQTGKAITVASEDEIDRLTAISGSGPGYIFEIIRSFIKATEGLGFSPQTAQNLVLGTMAGAVETARLSDDSAETLHGSVTSKGGTTEAGLAELCRGGILERLLADTVEAAYARAKALH